MLKSCQGAIFCSVRAFSTTTCLLKKPNITRPRVPGTERRILDAITVPVLPEDTRPLPQKCADEFKQSHERSKSELQEAYEAFRLRQAQTIFIEHNMVAICHRLPLSSRELLSVRTKIMHAGLKVFFVNSKLARQAVENSRLHNLLPFMQSTNAYILSEENKLVDLMKVLRKTPELQLLGGVVEGRIMSRDAMMNCSKLPPLDTLRGELLTVLKASAGKTSRLLSRHQQDLTFNLGQIVKGESEHNEPKS